MYSTRCVSVNVVWKVSSGVASPFSSFCHVFLFMQSFFACLPEVMNASCIGQQVGERVNRQTVGSINYLTGRPDGWMHV